MATAWNNVKVHKIFLHCDKGKRLVHSGLLSVKLLQDLTKLTLVHKAGQIHNGGIIDREQRVEHFTAVGHDLIRTNARPKNGLKRNTGHPER